MNDPTLTHLKVIVERAVRPVRASLSCKRKMREELLAHVSTVFEEERTRLGEERAALEQAAQRFGNPTELTSQLQESVPASDFLLRLFEGMVLEHGGSTLRRVVRYASVTFLGCAVFLLPAFFLQERMHEWPVLLAIPVGVFGFIFLADGMRQALDGPTGRSWPRAILVALASWLLVPGVTFGVLLTYSGDVRSSLMDVLPLVPGAVLTPVFFVAPVHGFAAEIRSHREWASLQIN
jgi:ATP-dependent Clp protease ATP-binding subunit ClpC